MSIEDLRNSNVDGDHASHEMISDVHEAAGREDAKLPEVERVELAQAQTNEQSPKADRIEATPPAQANAGSNEVVPDQNNVAHLAANVSLDDIRIEGANLVLVQPDGTEIIIVNGAAHVPTFLLGDVELPRDTVIAALNDSHINVAAGPDGGDTASAAAPSSGADFQDTIQGNDDAPTELAALLADTQQPDATPGLDRENFDDQPIISFTDTLVLTENADGEGNFESGSVNGQFGFLPGANAGVITAVNYVGGTDVDEEGGSTGKALSGLTSDGHAVTVTVNGLTITGTIIVGEGAGAHTVTVFELKVTNIQTGAFTFTQYGPLDHPDLNQAGASDVLRLNFTYTVTDKDGDTVIGKASIDIRDDGPSIDLGEQKTDDSAVSEHSLLSGAVATGNVLGVQWGADNGAHRDLTFDKQSAPAGLTSHSLAIQYDISADGHTLTGYTVSGEGEGAVRTNVFVVTLDPTAAHGSYTFQLLTSIDHPHASGPAGGEGGPILLSIDPQDLQIDLSFAVTAKDADGDTTPTSFTVTVNDDVPVANNVTNSTVMQDDNQTLFPGNTDSESVVTSVSGGTGSLFAAGADGFKSVVLSGEQQAFSAIYKGADGFAHTESVSWGNPSVSGTDTTFTATGGFTGQTVATLVVHADGSYEFKVFAPIVQSGHEGVEENISLTVNFTVTDGDNDTAKGSLTVSVNDDAPSANVVTAGTTLQDEGQALFAGNKEEGVANETSASGAAGALFKAGADGAGSVSFTPPEDLQAIRNVDGHGVAENLSYATTTDQNGNTILTATGVDSHATIFTLTVNADGSYKFELSAPLAHGTHGATEETLPVTIGFTVTDGDGDAATGSLTINVNDDVPTASIVNETAVTLQDEGQTVFAGNNEEGVTNSTSISGAAGVLFRAGADGVGSVSFTAPEGLQAIHNVNGHGVAENLSYATATDANGNTILTATGADSRATVFTLTVNADGSYKFDLSAPLVHGTSGATEEDLAVNIGFRVTDGDGDTADGSLTIHVNDDVPVVTGTIVAVTADEGDIYNLRSQGNSAHDGTADGSSSELALFGLGLAATVSGSVATTVAFGADGSAAKNAFSFTGDATSTLANMHLSSKGGELSYTVIGNTILGFVNNNGGGYTPLIDRPVLSITLNSDGSFKFQQYDQLDHAPGTGNDLKSGEGTVAGIDFGSVIKATDGDGDTVVIGGKLVVTITDDVPVVSISLTGNVVTHDETSGNDDGADDTAISKVGSIFAAFEGSENVSALGYAREKGAIVNFSTSVGADEPSKVSLTLDVTTAASGLKTTSDEAITLTEENGLVVGRDAHGEAVFAISIDSSGRVSIAQYQAIQHPDGNNANDLVNLTGKISAVISATDYDGDTATQSIDIGGKIQFRDDAPVLSGNSVTVTADEGDIFNVRSQGNSANDGTGDGSSSDLALFGLGLASTVSGSVAATVSFGADGAAAGGGFSFTADAAAKLAAMHLSSQGGQLSYTVIGNTILGYVDNAFAGYTPIIDRPVLSITLNNDGSFKYQQYDQLDHAPGAGNDLKSGSTTISGIDVGSIIKATDGDGDSITLDGKLIVRITDDIPTVSISLTGRIVTHDETFGIDNNSDDTKSNQVRSIFSSFETHETSAVSALGYARESGAIVNYGYSIGADEPGKVSLTLSVTNSASGLKTTAGEAITLSMQNGLVIGRDEHGKAVFAISIDSDGRVSIAQYQAIQHPVGSNPNDLVDLTGKIAAVVTATDYDGDTATKSVDIGGQIQFRDDAPVLKAPVTSDLTLLENDLSNGTSPDGTHLSATGSLSISLGVDGGDVALQAAGATWNASTHTLTAQDGSWNIVLNNNGTYTFNLVHATAHGANGADNLSIAVTYTATDGDNDSITGNFNIVITDDIPAVSLASSGVTVVTDESVGAQADDAGFLKSLQLAGLFSGIHDAGNDPQTLGIPVAFAQSASAVVTPSINFGADGAAASGSVVYSLSVVNGTDSGLTTTDNHKIYLFNENGFIVGRYDVNEGSVSSTGHDPAAFAMSIGQDGKLSVVQYVSLNNGNLADPNDQVSIKVGAVTAVVTAKDDDGDTVSAGADISGQIRFQDDGPSVSVSRTPFVFGVTADESVGLQADDKTSLAAIFDSVHDKGQDPDRGNAPLAYAQSAVGSLVDATYFGVDGAATINAKVYSLSISSEGVDSGLKTTDGQKIYLFSEGGIVVGRVGGSAGSAAIAIAIDPANGKVSTVEYLSLNHGNPNNTNETVALANGTVRAVLTVTDGDGDTASGSADISSGIQFRDDAPVLNGQVSSGLTLNEDDLANGSSPDASHLSVKGDLDISLGADGGKIVLAADHATWDGSKTLTGNDGSWKIVLNGDGTYTFSLLHATTHGVQGADNFDIKVTYTATDGDGDKITGDFNVTIKDDVPVATDGDRYITLGEARIDGATPDTGSKPFTVHYGANGAGTTTFTGEMHLDIGPGEKGNVDFTLTAAQPTHLSTLTSQGQQITFALTENGTKIIGYVGNPGHTVIELTANGTSVTAKLFGPVDHTALANGAAIDQLRVDAGVAFHDGDGDTTTSIIRLEINDDKPVVTEIDRYITLDESDINGATPDAGSRSFTVDYGADGAGTTTFSGRMHLDIGPGTAGNVDFTLTAAQPTYLSSLTSEGQKITFALTDNGTKIIGYVGNPGHTVIELTANGTSVTAKLFGPVDHTALANGSAIGQLRIDAQVAFHDGDGDATNSIIRVEINDDVPTVSDPSAQAVEEDGTKTLAGISLNIDWGADSSNSGPNGGRSVVLKQTVGVAGSSAMTGLYSNGNEIRTAMIDGHLVGYIGATAPAVLSAAAIVFVVSVSDVTAAYSFELRQPLDHPAPGNGSQFIDLTFGYNAIDSDGDVSNDGHFTVHVDAAGSLGSIHYDNLAQGVFVNLSGASQTAEGQTVAAHMAQDRASQGGNVVGHDALGNTTDAYGSKGNDILIGGDEANHLVGNEGDDILDGGKGSDLLEGGAGNDTFKLGADLVASGERNIELGNGTKQAIDITGYAGTMDVVQGGEGYDKIVLDSGDLTKGFAYDAYSAPSYISSVEEIDGTAKDDIILVGADYRSGAANGGILIEGGAGNDVIGGGAGDDILRGGTGDDLISGLGGNDTIEGGAGNDTIYGGAGNDIIRGGDDDDKLFGDAGNDTIDGGNGNDQITGGAGNDGLLGGAGDDTFFYVTGDGADRVMGNSGNDKLDFTNNGASTTIDIGTIVGGQELNYGAGNAIDVQVSYGNGAGSVRMDEVETIGLHLGNAGDTVNIGSLAGTSIASTITIEGGSGDDHILATNVGVGNPVSIVVNAGDGNDEIRTGAGNDIVDGGKGNDTINGGGGNDHLSGGEGNDTIGGGTGDDTIVGGEGNDTIWGDAGGDHIYGNGTDLSVHSNQFAMAGEADRANFNSEFSTYDVHYNAETGELTVTAKPGSVDYIAGGNNTDDLHGIEIVAFKGGVILDLTKPVLLYDGDPSVASTHLVGTFDSIQSAVNASLSYGGGATVLVGAGSFNENVTIDHGVTIMGAEHGIPATQHTGSESVINGQWTISSSVPVTVDGFKFNNVSPAGSTTDATLSIVRGTTSGSHVISNNIFYSNVDGGDRSTADGDAARDDRAIFVSVGATTGEIDITGNLITGQQGDKYGAAAWGRGIWSDGNGVHLDISDNTIEHTRSGLNLDDSVANSPVTVHDNTFNDVGTGISLGANWSGDITASFGHNDFHGVDQEFNLANLGNGVTFDASAATGVVDDTPSSLFYMTGSQGGDTITGTGGVDLIQSQGGDDKITAGAGDDMIDGGAGIDTAAYTTSLTIDNLATTPAGGWTVSAGAEGKDTLSNVEIVDGAEGGRILLVGNGGFATIQAAVNAAHSGDTILVAPGTYNENVVIDMDNLTLLSSGGAGTTIINGVQAGNELGTIQLASGADNVKIGATDHGFTINGINGNGPVEKAAIYVQGDHQHLTVQGNTVNANGDEALLTEYGKSINDFKIDGNTFGGKTFVGDNPQTTGGQWDVDNNIPRGLVVINGAEVNGVWTVQGVNFTNNNVIGTAGGVGTDGTERGNSLVTIDADHSNIHHNTITGFTDGDGFGLRARGPNTNITENVIDNRVNGSESQGFYIDNHYNGADHQMPNYNANAVYGGSANEVLFGTPGGETINGGDGNDTIIGGTGNDTLIGGNGGDTFIYSTGDGNDHVIGGNDAFADTLDIRGNGSDNVFRVENLDNNDHLEVTVDAGHIDVTGVEEITIQGGGGSDSLVVAGNLNGTGLATSTIHFDGGDGNDTVDLSARTSAHRVVADGGNGTDSANLGFAFNAEGNAYKAIVEGNQVVGVEITHKVGAASVTDVFTNFESFQFSDGPAKTLQDILAPKLSSSLPAGATLSEDSHVQLSAIDLKAALSSYVVDADTKFEDLTFTLTIPHSSLGDNGVITFKGSDVPALDFLLQKDFNGSIGASLSVSDGFFSDSKNIALTVTPVNDAPHLALGQTAGFTINEDTALYFAETGAKNWVASDPDQADGKISSVTLTLHVDAGGTFSASSYGLSGGFDIVTSDNGKTISITTTSFPGDTRDAYSLLNSLLRGDNHNAVTNKNGIAFTPDQDFNGQVSVHYTLDDHGNFGGSALTEGGDFTINVTPVNDAPVIDLDSRAQAAGNDLQMDVHEQMPMWFADYATLGDVDSSNIRSLTATLTNTPDGAADTLYLKDSAKALALSSGLTVTLTDNHTVSVVGTASVSVYETILRGLVYNNTSDNPTTQTDRVIEVSVSDGDKSATQHATIHVIAVNDAPVLAGDLDADVIKGQSYTLTKDDLYFTDPDNTSVTFQISNAQHGGIYVNGASANAFTSADILAGIVSFKHDNSSGTTAQFDVKVEDGNQEGSVAVAQTFHLDVTIPNAVPTVESVRIATDAANSISIPVQALLWHAHDPEGAELSFALPGSQKHVSYTPGSDHVDYVIQGSTNGFHYTVSDGANSPVGADVTVVGKTSFVGTAHDDFFIANGSNTYVLVANAGDDIIVAGNNSTNVIYGDGQSEASTDGNDLLIGGKSATNVLWGGGGNDLLIGGSNATNEMHGGSGNDHFILGVGATNTVYGDAGIDLLDFSAFGAAVNVALSANSGVISTQFGNTSYSGIEGVVGTDFNDILQGNAGDNYLYGGAGLNTLTGGGGHDTFFIDASALNKLDPADIITDYKATGAASDKLDVSSLLDALIAKQPGMTDADALSKLSLSTSGNTTTLSITASASDTHAVATLQNVDANTAVKILFHGQDHDLNQHHNS